jgi:hypothetical protein
MLNNKIYSRVLSPEVPKPHEDMIRSYDGKMVPRNAIEIITALQKRIEINIDLAYKSKAQCSHLDPDFCDCDGCQAAEEYLLNAAWETTRLFKVCAAQSPAELICHTLRLCMEREITSCQGGSVSR